MDPTSVLGRGEQVARDRPMISIVTGKCSGALGTGRGPASSLEVEKVTGHLSCLNTRRGVGDVEDILRENSKFKKTRNVHRGL